MDRRIFNLSTPLSLSLQGALKVSLPMSFILKYKKKLSPFAKPGTPFGKQGTPFGKYGNPFVGLGNGRCHVETVGNL